MSVEDTSRHASTFYKWSCPICEVARGSRADDPREAVELAKRSLRVHIRMTADDGHGPRFGYPETVSTDDLDGHVELLDDR